jgi:hypothetical protein
MFDATTMSQGALPLTEMGSFKVPIATIGRAGSARCSLILDYKHQYIPSLYPVHTQAIVIPDEIPLHDFGLKFVKVLLGE